MKRRTFLNLSAVAASATLLARETLWARDPAQTDLVLRNAVIFDGTGNSPVEGDVAVSGDRIIGVGTNLRANGAEEMDLRGLALAPGFIDIHSHTDRELFTNPRAESKVRQGVTTEVAGQDGSSVAPGGDYRDLGAFFEAVERNGSAVNIASMVGQGTVRGYVIGGADRPATDEEIARMQAEVQRALEAGACGVSSGLEYTPSAFADTMELAAVCEPLRGRGLPYASHMRNEDDRLLAAIEEALMVGRRAGVPVQISHLKAQGERNWWKTDPAFQTIEAARDEGIDVMFDVYPYIAYSTGLSNLFPVQARDGGTDAFLGRLQDAETRRELEVPVRDKIDQLGSWDAVQIASVGSDQFGWAEGHRLGELAEERGEDPYDLLVRLLIEDRSRPRMIGYGMSEENVSRKLAHPLSLVCSDGSALATYGRLSSGSPHPRSYGTFPRVLGYFSRELGVLPLEVAIHKMTALPADRLQFPDRGRIAVGGVADLVVFDPDTVEDRATFENPHQYPAGIPHVMVGGEWVIRDEEHTDALPGRVVRPSV